MCLIFKSGDDFDSISTPAACIVDCKLNTQTGVELNKYCRSTFLPRYQTQLMDGWMDKWWTDEWVDVEMNGC